MIKDNKTEIQQEIWKIVKDINQAWAKNRTADLTNFFHQDMVIVSPDFQKLGDGRENCIKSYEDFCSQATVHSYEELEPVIDIFTTTAVIIYRFKISYEMKGKVYDEMGRDMFVLQKEAGKWLAVWRMVIPDTYTMNRPK
jgi:hypothetical protein